MVTKSILNLNSKFKYIIKSRIQSMVKVHFDRQSMFHVAWGHIFNNHLRGDYWEFGVYQGDSLLLSYNELCKFVNWNKNQLSSEELWRRELAQTYQTYNPRFIGFDTFESMPNNNEENIQYAANTFQTSLSSVQKRTDKLIKNCQTFLIKGDFTQIHAVPEFLEGTSKIAILNIDSDLYISAKSALNLAKNHLQIGTVIMFDEFHGFGANNLKGERLALSEFIAETGIEVDKWFDYHYGGRAFLVTKV